jgi:hypothetical protein
MSTLSNFVIPFDNFPEQFDITLAGVDYTIISKYNDADGGGWVIDIQDSLGNPIACNIPMITGADMLDGLEYLGIGGSLFVQTTGASPFDVPTLDNLGIDSNVYFQTTSLDE